MTRQKSFRPPVPWIILHELKSRKNNREQRFESSILGFLNYKYYYFASTSLVYRNRMSLASNRNVTVHDCIDLIQSLYGAPLIP